MSSLPTHECRNTNLNPIKIYLFRKCYYEEYLGGKLSQTSLLCFTIAVDLQVK